MSFWKNIKLNIKKKFSPYKALNGIDKKLEKYLNKKNGFYIEMGANDGITQSNTYFLEKKYNWRGLLVEPSEKFNMLKKQRSSFNIFSNAACCSFKKKNSLIKFSYNNLMTLALNLSGDVNKKKHINDAKSHTDKQYEFEKKGVPLNDLLSKNKVQKLIDFFYLDVEGAESSVLYGFSNLN
jgi:FkbM family methyltransferase